MEANLASTISNTIQKIHRCTEKPENYLEVQYKIADELTSSTQVLYDALKENEETKSKDTLPALLVDQYDDEQIWQQIDMQNNCGIKSLIKQVSHVTAGGHGSFQTKNFTSDVKLKISSSHNKTKKSVEDLETDEASDSLSDAVSIVDDEESNIFGGDEETESEDEKEIRKLLDKVHSSRQVDDSDDGDDDDDSDDTEDKDQNQSGKKRHVKKRATVVDDKFFKISDLEEFLNEEDAREERRMKREERGGTQESSSEEEEDVDYELPDEEEEGIHYKDFFDPPDPKSRKKNKRKHVEEEIDEQIDAEDDEEMDAEVEHGEMDDGEDEMEEGDDDSDGESVSDVVGGKTPTNKLSAFERRQLKMKEKISSLEQSALADKPWQLMGEATSTGRPQNSLLAENLDFEQTTKLPPVITEETTQRLEDIIKQRIKDKAWDDVERKVKTKEAVEDYQRRLVLDQDKSKLSLSQIYEQEYLSKLETDTVEKRDPQHEEIEKSMNALFKKLDALSNYHYTPKPAVAEVKIVSNVSSVTVEEVVPVGVSDAALLAPEELQEKTKLIGDREKSGTDRRRERREKKKRQKEKAQLREKKQKAKERTSQGGVATTSKSRAMKELKKQAKSSRGLTLLQEKTSGKSDLSSSKKFFTQLQEEVTSHVQSRKAQSRKKENAKKLTATKYML